MEQVTIPPKRPMIARCSDAECSHEWAVLYLPMDLIKAAQIMQRATCPMCGNQKPTVGSMV